MTMADTEAAPPLRIQCPVCLRRCSADDVVWACPATCQDPIEISLAQTCSGAGLNGLVTREEVSLPCYSPACSRHRTLLRAGGLLTCRQSFPTPWDHTMENRREFVILVDSASDGPPAISAFITMLKRGFGARVQGLDFASRESLNRPPRRLPPESPLRALIRGSAGTPEVLIGLRDRRPTADLGAASLPDCLSDKTLRLGAYLNRHTDLIVPLALKAHLTGQLNLTETVERIRDSGADRLGGPDTRLWFVVVGGGRLMETLAESASGERLDLAAAPARLRDTLMEGGFAAGLQMQQAVQPLVNLWSGSPPVWTAVPARGEVMAGGHALWSIFDSLAPAAGARRESGR